MDKVSAYSKLLAAVFGTLLSRWIIRWTGLDFAALGVASEYQQLINLTVDFAVTGVVGFGVWFFPMGKKYVEDKVLGSKVIIQTPNGTSLMGTVTQTVSPAPK